MNYILSINNGFISLIDSDITKDILTIPSFEVRAGETVSIYAPNGSGKTSFLNSLFKKPGYLLTGKENYINLIDFADISCEQMLPDHGVGFLQQNPVIIPNLTYKILINTINTKIVNSPLKSLEETDLNKLISTKLEVLGLTNADIEKEIGNCSSGERKLLDLFLISLFEVNLLLIDELDANLDEENKEKLINFILTNKKMSFIIVSHDKEYLTKCECNVFYTISNKVLKRVRKI